MRLRLQNLRSISKSAKRNFRRKWKQRQQTSSRRSTRFWRKKRPSRKQNSSCPEVEEISEEQTEEVPEEEAEPEVEEKEETVQQESNHNAAILELHRQGASEIEIAKELGLGVGEVKLVLGLFREEEA